MSQNTIPTPTFPPPVGPPAGGPAPPRRALKRKHVIGYTATALIALGIGAASRSGGEPTAAPTTAPTVTVTETVAGSQATVPGPEVTVTQTVRVPAPAKTVTAAPPAAAVSFPGDGMYQVGVDIKPGTYVSKGPQELNCYWARLKGSGGGFSDIIANANTSGQAVVTIRSSDKFFETLGCNDWRKR